MINEEQVIQQTKKWITDVVIACNFCPFAERAIKHNSVRYLVIQQPTLEELLQTFLDECVVLDVDDSIETSLLIITNSLDDFEEYLDVVTMAEKILEDHDYEGLYQVASFHPQYRFEGAPPEDAANYTNRSPYPMLHLLREESIDKALVYYEGDPDEIPNRNIDFARQKGLTYMKMLRDSCLS